MTARWVADIAEERDLQPRWKSISLLFKNNPDPEAKYYGRVEHTHKLLRVMEAVRAGEGEDAVDKLYWEFGRRIHHDGDRRADAAESLEAVGLDTSYAEAYDDEKWDSVIREAMDEGLALVGDDVGTPIIALDTEDGERAGIFGPVITRVPPKDDAIKLWDNLVWLNQLDGFWELKRTRTESPEFGERP